MDALFFIDSNDIRKYLKSIGYKPGLLESAFFIYQSKLRTIREKHRAWAELIQNTDDVILDEKAGKRWGNTKAGRSSVYGMSVHDLIRKHMDEEKAILEFFCSRTENTVYVPSFLAMDFASASSAGPAYTRGEADFYFGTFEEANSYCLRTIRDKSDEYVRYRISKNFLAKADEKYSRNITVDFNARGDAIQEYVSVGAEADVPKALKTLLDERTNGIYVAVDFFESMWFDIPIPFKEGDIVWAKPYGWGMETYPFVLRYTVPWAMRKRLEDGKEYREGCDSSDMNASGWTVGFGDYEDEIYDDMMADYLSLEYYRGDYQGKERLLPLLAEMLKGNLDIWEYERIKSEILITSNSSRVTSHMMENSKFVFPIIQGVPTWPREENWEC